MGTWVGPATKEQKTSLRKKLKELKILQDEICGLFGDDELLDGFMNAEERISWALNQKWINTEHEIPLEVFKSVRFLETNEEKE